MRIPSLLAVIALTSCATTPTEPSGGGPEGGKGDGPSACGSACDPSLCAWDCSGTSACTPACTDDRGSAAYTVVTATEDGFPQTMDSRTLPYVPANPFDPAISYGCLFSTYSSNGEGLGIRYTEYDSRDPFSPIVVTDRDFDAAFYNYAGPGTYTGHGVFSTQIDGYDEGPCTFTVASDDLGLTGTATCTMTKFQIAVQFACPGNSLANWQTVAMPMSNPS